MRKVLALSLLLASPVYADCYDSAMTQSDINQCAYEEYQAVDKKLDKLFDEILKRHDNDEKTKAQIEKIKKRWVAFREEEVKLLYSDKRGTVAPACEKAFRAKLTESIEKAISETLDLGEGDVCRI